MTNPRSWRTAFLRILTILAFMVTPLLMAENAYALPDTWSSGITVTSWNISGTTATMTFTIITGGSYNFSLWGEDGSFVQHGSCGGCSGGSSYTSGQSITLTANSCTGCANMILYGQGCSYVFAYYPYPNNAASLNAGVCGGSPTIATNSTASAPYCTGTDIQNPSGSYVLDSSGTSGALSIRFTWSITTAPSSFSGWTVEFPGDGSGFTSTLGIGATVDGAPNVYYGEWDGVTSHTPLTATIIAPTASGHTGCQVTFSLSTNQISKIPPDNTTGAPGDTQTSTNANCGFSFNPFHYLKCLFEPSHSLQQWNDLKTTAQTRPPMSIIIGGISYVSDAYAFFNGANASGGVCVSGGDCLGGNASNVPFESPAFNGAQDTDASNNGSQAAQRLDLITSMGNLVQNNGWGTAGYWIISAGIWIYGLLQIWERISSSFGSKSP